MATITITRALSKIKTLTNQLNDDLKSNQFMTTAPNNMIGSESYNKLVKSLESNKESFDSKIAQIINLKKLIAKSNLETTIVVSEKEVSVTEALAMKETMAIYSKFFLSLRKQYTKATEEVNLANSRIHAAISGNTSEISSSSDIKNEDLEERLALNAKQLQESMGIKVITGSYETGEEYLEAIKDYVNNFVSEIDYLLSEHNSTTLIEVE